MMVSVEQFKTGLASYIDSECVSKLQGFKKLIVAAEGAALIEVKMRGLLSGENHEYLRMRGYVADDGMIDADAIYNQYRTVAEKYGPITENISFLGPVTFSASDIDSIYRHIMSH